MSEEVVHNSQDPVIGQTEEIGGHGPFYVQDQTQGTPVHGASGRLTSDEVTPLIIRVINQTASNVPQLGFINIDDEINRLQPWFIEADLRKKLPRERLPDGMPCDVAAVINQPIDETWRRIFTSSRRYTPLRFLRTRLPRTIEQKRDQAQKEIYANGCSHWLEPGSGEVFQPPFILVHPLTNAQMCMGTLELSADSILEYVAGDDVEYYAMVMQFMYSEIVPRLRDNVYGNLLPLAMANFYEEPALIPHLPGTPYGSRSFGDIMSKLYYGLTSISGASHWLGVGPGHPKTPIYTIVNVAFLLAWGMRAAFLSDTILPLVFEEFNYDAHLVYVIHLLKSEAGHHRFSQHETQWIAKGGMFHD